MGKAGRQRVEQHFTWERVVRSYEGLWREQEAERRSCQSIGPRRTAGPPCYPAPEVSFAGYPTILLDGGTQLRTVSGAANELGRILALPLCTYAGQRVQDEATLQVVLAAASSPRTLNDLEAVLANRGVAHGPARATLAWLLKYGLLEASQ